MVQKIKTNWKITENLHTINVTSKNTRKAKIAKKLRGKEWIELQNQLQKFVLFDIFDM